MDGRLLLLLPIAFGAGIVTAVSPCVFPVLPILFAGGASGGRRPAAAVRDHRRPRRELRDLHPGRDVGAGAASPAAGLPARPLDRAPLRRRRDADLPPLRRTARAPVCLPQPARAEQRP